MSKFFKRLLRRIFVSNNDKIIKQLAQKVECINNLEPSISILSDQALKEKTQEFQYLLSTGKTLNNIIYEAFAVVREASKRVIGMRHFDEQLMGGLLLHSGKVTEMRTGEGKTLVATLPSYLNALTGMGVHVVTVNNYLAHRDSQWMGQIHQFLGLEVGCVISDSSEEERIKAYNAHITYATNNELGFDFLRDNMKFDIKSKVQRKLHYAIIDEIDSILIDEARTPLIISGPVDDNTDLYVLIDQIIRKLLPEDYEKDEKFKNVNLTESGINKMESLFIQHQLIAPGSSLYDLENMQLIHYINQALKAHTLFNPNVDYLVKDNQVILIDEFTGRMMDGRRYSEGLHQALEAKEGVEIQNENQTLASITFQNYFRMYQKLSGMTGTAMTEALELKETYNLDVVSVPTHKPMQRLDLDDEIYGSKTDKYNAIIKLITECYEKGQPVLVGTISIEKSEELSKLLKIKKIPHNILNAKYHEQEAIIIAQAGRYKAITIATNMAGRGTDIMLGGNLEMLVKQIDQSKITEEQYQEQVHQISQKIELEKKQVIEAGGLFVIGTERHESRRIDNQLRGRSGRQSDPGSTKFFLSLEDDLMRIFASDRISSILRTIGLKDGEAIQHPLISRSLEKAQQKIEAQNYEIRKNLLKYDDVMSEQRKIIYNQRNETLSASDLMPILTHMTDHLVEECVSRFIPAGSYREEWKVTDLVKEVEHIFNLLIDESEITKDGMDNPKVINYLTTLILDAYNIKLENYGSEVMNESIQYVIIKTLDQVWKEHLHALDHVRQGISLRAYGQKEPLNEYKREAFYLFEGMLSRFKYLSVQRLAHLRIDLEQINAANLQKNNNNLSIQKVPRNSPCPCASGKKYKYCHGAL